MGASAPGPGETSPRFGGRFLAPRALESLLALGDAAELATGTSRAESWSIAGRPLAVAGLDRPQVHELRGALGEHVLAPPAAGDGWSLEVRRAPESVFLTPSEARAGEAFWEYFLDLEPAREHVRVAGLDFFALLERPPARRVVAILPELRGGRLLQAMHNLLRVTTAFAVLDAGGLLLHSAAFLAPGASGERAVVVPGRSGAGKSTLAGRARELGWRILSDELNVVWPGAVEQVPFTGDLGRQRPLAGRHALAAVLPLVRTGRDERPPLSGAELYARLLAEAVFVNADPPSAPSLEAAASRLVNEAARRGRLEALSFTPEGELEALRGLGDLEMARAS